MSINESSDEFDPFAGPAIVRTSPTTEAQREIWTATRISDESSLCYNESVSISLSGSIDLEALTDGFADVVARHEALRSTISDDGLTFLVGEVPAATAQIHDLTELPEAEREAFIQALVEREVETPFELHEGPLFRMHLIRISNDQVRAVLTAHHIVFDGWSMAVVLTEWAACYNARVAGTAPDIERPPSYADYAVDEIEYLSSTDHRVDEDFWLEQYRGTSLPTLDLPSDRPRPRLRTFEARRCDVPLQPELIQTLRKTGAKHGASLFTTLLAGFEALLFRLSGQEDVIVGIPAAGQSTGDWQGLVGHCVNLLPLRNSLDAELAFSELLGAAQGAMFDAHDHQRLTFGSLVAQLPIPRDPSRPPLVSVIFNLDRGMSSEAIGFADIEAQVETNERHYENFDLFLNAVELPDGVVLECQYNTGLFDETTVRRWMAAYERLLGAVANEPETPLGGLPLVSEDERNRIARWNTAAEADHPLDSTFNSMFSERAMLAPNAIACEFEGRELSYGDLSAQANQLARVLRSNGVGRGDLVGLSVERSERMIIGLVGILRSGAGYVPLDPGFPRDRLDYMVDSADIGALVTERATHAELGLDVETVVHLDDDGQFAGISTDALDDPESEAAPEDVAYVIFTSGSTGQPKGVQVPHRALANLMHSVARTPGMSSEDVVLAVTTLSFDIAISELLLPLTVGAKIVLASREVASDGGQLLELLQRSGSTFIDATPATYRLLFGAGFEGDPNLKVICTGEAMPMELGQRLVECVASLWNGYGPTETTVWSSFHRVEPAADRVLIGFPVDNTQLYVLDDRLQPMPIGVPGELYIAGRGLSLGYLGQPDLTAERFVPDPISADSGLMYKSGDLARYLPDGQLECLGRNDHQVKIRGYRIELGEIEHVLDRHPHVGQSVVTAREDIPGDTRLVGYVRSGGGEDPSGSELRDHLKQSLPDYMVPSTFVSLTEFPLTPSGKVDRAALPTPDPTTAGSDRTLVEPRTETESLVAELFQEALSVPRLSVDDDFFALGGHSLLASQVLARLRTDHGISLSFRTIFEAPTVEQLAATIEEMSDEVDDRPAPAIERRTETGDVSLSVVQERLWLLEEMDPSQELVHNLPAAWRLEGPVDIELLQRAVDEIVHRHGTLRTHLVRSGSSVVQRIEPGVDLAIEAVDLRDVPESERESELARLMGERTRERFDLYGTPLFRSYLIRIDDERYVFHTVRHNIIWDGWSFDIFLQELTTLYSAFERGESSPLPELPVSYGDYVDYQRRFLEGPEIARQIDFWRERLAGDLPEATLPTDRPRPRASQHEGENLVVHLGREKAEALTTLGREHGATLYMVLLAAFKTMLHRYSHERDVVVGTPVRARQVPEVEGLIGPFINAVVLRTDVEPSLSFTDLLNRVREVTLDSFSNQDMPLELLGTRPPVVRTFFSFQDAKNRPPTLGDVPVEQLHAEPPAAANDLMLWVMDTPTDLLAVANYSSELYDHATIEAFLDGFGTLLEAIVATPDAPIATLPISAAGPAAALRRGQPDGQLLDDLGASLGQLSLEPDAPALRSGDRVVSSAELAAQAAGIVPLLDADGRELVAIHAPQLRERVAAMLACLALDRPFTLLAGDGPAAFVSRQRSERGCRLLLAAEDSDVPDDPDVVRIGPPDDSTALTAVEGSQHAIACVSAGGNATSRATLATLADALGTALGLASGQQVAWALPAGSDPELLLTLATLRSGASGIALSSRDRLDRSTFGDIDVLVAAPSTLSRYSDGELETVSSIAVVGEPSLDLAERLLADGRRLQRLHVTDEVGLAAFVGDIVEPGAGTCIGQPLYPTQAVVLDASGNPCDAGIEGELFVATTAPVGVESAPVSPSHERHDFTTTGDTGRVRADGRFEIRAIAPGAIDSMGVRVLGDGVARCIEEHPAIINAHVTVTPAPAGDLRLTAFVQATPTVPYTATELRRHVRDRVPEEMVPQLFVDTDEWPTAADGSLDVDALQPNERNDATFVGARSESERLVAEIWQEDLGVGRVGAHDNFFALGGHSLLCFKVLSRIEQRTSVRLSPRVMLLGSLEQIAIELDTALDHSAGDEGPATPSASEQSGDASDPTGDPSSLRGRLRRKLRNSGSS